MTSPYIQQEKAMFIASACEHLPGEEIGFAKIFSTRKDALDWINEIFSGFCGANHSFRLFELGKELPLTQKTVEEPQPAKKVKKFV